jgi:ATP-dependent Clp protease ATP-binding subunit ClpA
MFERFSERARQVVVLAQEEARMLKHNYIGTEHVLLGLLREEEGLAARVLESLDVTLERVRAQVVRIVGSGEEITSGQIPFTPRGKKVLELALRESLSLGHNYIGTEHILLGLARENEGVGARILLEFDADSEKIRTEVIRMLSGPGGRRHAEIESTPSRQRLTTIDAGWLGGLGPLLDRLTIEIRDELGRKPDAGDLLLALACVPGTLVADALRELGVDLDALWGIVERDRLQRSRAQDELARHLTGVRRAKEQALEAQEFERAAQLRDEERELVQEQRARSAVPPEMLDRVRKYFGIPSPPEDTPGSSNGD